MNAKELPPGCTPHPDDPDLCFRPRMLSETSPPTSIENAWCEADVALRRLGMSRADLPASPAGWTIDPPAEPGWRWAILPAEPDEIVPAEAHRFDGVVDRASFGSQCCMISDLPGVLWHSSQQPPSLPPVVLTKASLELWERTQ